MTDCVSTLRLQDAWRECQRHAYHLRRAFHLPGAILPMTGSRFGHLSDEQIQTSISDFVIRMECPMALCRSAILAFDKQRMSLAQGAILDAIIFAACAWCGTGHLKFALNPIP